MLKSALNILLVSIFVLALTACSKDDATEPLPEIGPVPSISVVSVEPNTIQEFGDLTFTINYEDGNGDIGFESVEDKSLFITDMRFPVDHEYHIRPLAPTGNAVTIQGELVVELNSVIFQDPGNTTETINFQVRLKDRAGNWSNTANSPAITISK